MNFVRIFPLVSPLFQLFCFVFEIRQMSINILEACTFEFDNCNHQKQSGLMSPLSVSTGKTSPSMRTEHLC